MHSLGNDFVLIDNRHSPRKPALELRRRLADRRLGIGCDQLLVLEEATDNEADAHCLVFNADGGEAEQCGNGMRCAALYLQMQAARPLRRVVISTAGGVAKLYPDGSGSFRAQMNIPSFEPADIPLRVPRRQRRYSVRTPVGELHFMAVSIGNPHAVLQVEDSAAAPVSEVGDFLERSSLFPLGVNTGFMQVLDADHIRLRVHERGVGETRACGTGACAAVAAGRYNERLSGKVSVCMPGGELRVEWEGEGCSVWLGGPAAYVFGGTWNHE